MTKKSEQADAKLLKAMSQANKALKTIRKAQRNLTAPADPNDTETGKGQALLRESLGFTNASIHETTYKRFMANYNQRVPITLLVSLAMDAVDEGRITLPSVDEAKRQFNDLIQEHLQERPVAVTTQEYFLSVEDMLAGKDKEGNELPQVIKDLGKRIRAEADKMMEQSPEPDPLDVAKQDAEEHAPDTDAPTNVRSIRFTNDPFETSHDKDC